MLRSRIPETLTPLHWCPGGHKVANRGAAETGPTGEYKLTDLLLICISPSLARAIADLKWISNYAYLILDRTNFTSKFIPVSEYKFPARIPGGNRDKQ